MRDEGGTPRELVARICRPQEPGPARVALIAHGAPPRDADRPRMVPAACDSAPVRWFNARGFVVVLALRRGFGGSDGPVAESSGPCAAPDYIAAGLAGARDIAATLAFATGLPDVLLDGAVVVGQSTGGWATIAFAGMAPPGVALVSMAGGRGARGDSEDPVCRPDRLLSAARRFGAQARVPMLWVYAANDTSFPPAIATALQTAFTAGGGQAELHITSPYGSDGHQLLFAPGGETVWGGPLQSFLARQPATLAQEMP